MERLPLSLVLVLGCRVTGAITAVPQPAGLKMGKGAGGANIGKVVSDSPATATEPTAGPMAGMLAASGPGIFSNGKERTNVVQLNITNAV